MTPKDKELHWWLVQEASFNAGSILGYWRQKHIQYKGEKQQ